MLGMRRSSPLDCLERPPSKLLKDDHLSIYEATLLKLRNGSRRSLEATIATTKTEASEVNLVSIQAKVSPDSADLGLKEMEEDSSLSNIK